MYILYIHQEREICLCSHVYSFCWKPNIPSGDSDPDMPPHFSSCQTQGPATPSAVPVPQRIQQGFQVLLSQHCLQQGTAVGEFNLPPFNITWNHGEIPVPQSHRTTATAGTTWKYPYTDLGRGRIFPKSASKLISHRTLNCNQQYQLLSVIKLGLGRRHRDRDDDFWLRSGLRKASALEHVGGDHSLSSASSWVLGSQTLKSLPDLQNLNYTSVLRGRLRLRFYQ